jgi:hypothetical protein
LNADLPVHQRNYERILILLFLVTLPLVNPWVRGDGVGYYAYARAPLIEHSLDFTHDYQQANERFREGRLDAAGNVKPDFRTRTGHLDNHFTVGPAILWSPFLLLAHGGVLLARALGASVPADGFSTPYRYAMAFGTCLYGFLGLLLAFRLTRKYLGPTFAFVATLAIWWATPLPVYMYFNPSWSHAHSAFAVALFLWYWDATREQRTLTGWLTLGLIAGLMLDVYYANLMVLSALLVESLGQYAQMFRTGRSATPDFWKLLGRHFLFGLVVCLTLIPTFISRWIVYGGPLETGYLSLRDFFWTSPAFFDVLFSANHGLLAWNPILIFSILGMVLFAFNCPRVGVPLLTALGAFYLFITLYPDWAGISSFGNRFFVSMTALFILGLACAFGRFVALFPRPRIALGIASGLLACFIVWNLGLIYQWGTHLIPARGPISFREAAYNQFHVVPRQVTSHLHSYMFRRGELMQQIEKRDIEQLNKSVQPQD